jgi:hypothetical protein
LGLGISVFDICQVGECGLFGLVLYYFSRTIFDLSACGSASWLGKGVAVWVFGSLTFLAVLHVLEAFFALTMNGSIVLLRLYPFSSLFGAVDVVMYFWVSLAVASVLWGAMCIIALRSPLDTWLNMILRNAQSKNEEEVSIVSAKGNVLDMMNESLISNAVELGNVKDLVANVRAEVVGLRGLQDVVGGVKSDLVSLKVSLRKLESDLARNVVCPACGRGVQPDFRICPYCGEDLLRQKVLLAEAAVLKVKK